MFEGKEEFALLTGDNLAYVNRHRWPPLSYEKAMEEYREKYGGEEGEGVMKEGTRRRRNEACKVM